MNSEKVCRSAETYIFATKWQVHKTAGNQDCEISPLVKLLMYLTVFIK